ncbi:hypothetical protein QHH03_30565 [Aphanizomenon sp. 202]|nr:hypothetical protein [Aphanizomenon sp. 202]
MENKWKKVRRNERRRKKMGGNLNKSGTGESGGDFERGGSGKKKKKEKEESRGEGKMKEKTVKQKKKSRENTERVRSGREKVED